MAALAPFNPGTPTATTNFSIGGDGGIEHNEYLLPVMQHRRRALRRYELEFRCSDLTGYVRGALCDGAQL